MTRPLAGGPPGGLGGIPTASEIPSTGPSNVQADLDALNPYTVWRDALTGGVLVTSSPVVTPDLFFILDDGAGGDILFPTGSKWEVGASFFISVNHANAAFWSLPEFSVFGGGWSPLTSPVIKTIGLNVGASNESGTGEFQVTAPFDLGIRFRWSFALYSGPGGSEITVEAGYAKAVRTGSL